MDTDKRILRNLGMWMMLEKCKEVGIDSSGTVTLNPYTRRGERTYTLIKEGVYTPIMQVTFTRSNAPRFIYKQ